MEKCEHREITFASVNFETREAICKCASCGHIIKLEGLRFAAPKEKEETVEVEYRMTGEDLVGMGGYVDDDGDIAP